MSDTKVKHTPVLRVEHDMILDNIVNIYAVRWDHATEQEWRSRSALLICAGNAHANLLAAAKAALGILRERQGFYGQYGANYLIPELEAAIAKAEGGAK